jgi:integrase/recombinase XerD
MKTDSPMYRYLAGFRLHCVAEGKSSRTVEWYEHKLRIFANYVEDQYSVDDPAAVEPDQIRAFLVHMREDVQANELNPHRPAEDRPLSAFTVQGYHRAIKCFCNWLVREEYLEKSPAQHISRPKAPRSIVKTFDPGQVRRLLSVPDRHTAAGFRSYTIMLLLLDTGIRLSELTGLRTQDLHLEQGYIQVQGKGEKQRLVPVGNKVRKVLWQYMARHRPETAYPEIANVFLDEGGRPIKGETVYRMVVRRGRQAGLEGVRCSPHTFRHTFAVSFLRNGGDVFSLQRILGHTSLVVTRMYCQLSESDIQAQHRRCSPVDRME